MTGVLFSFSSFCKLCSFGCVCLVIEAGLVILYLKKSIAKQASSIVMLLFPHDAQPNLCITTASCRVQYQPIISHSVQYSLYYTVSWVAIDQQTLQNICLKELQNINRTRLYALGNVIFLIASLSCLVLNSVIIFWLYIQVVDSSPPICRKCYV